MTATAGTRARAHSVLAGAEDRAGLRAHVARYGALPQHDDLIRLVDAAGLRGRGGAGFPTARKLVAVAAQGGRPVVVVNGAEGEPTSKKDRTLLRVAPHLVLDGAVAAARAVGANEVVVALGRPAPELQAAIAERERRDGVVITSRPVPDAFVAGEETALLRSLAGGPAKPTLKPPFPFERGLDGRPTLVQNVETLAHLALIARYGPDGFGAGTAVVTLGGAVAQPGVHEIPLGISLEEALQRCGGLSRPVSAYLVGGYFGGFVSADEAPVMRLTPDVLGAGAIVAMPRSTCAAEECARVIRYLANESAGQCGPCVHGLSAIADGMATQARGDRRADVLRWTKLVAGRGACRHPDGAAHFVDSSLRVFADEFDRHAHHRGCGRRAEGVLPV